MITPAFLKLPEAVAYSSIGRTVLYKLINSGAVLSHTVGTSRIISRASLDEFLAKQPVFPPNHPAPRGGFKKKKKEAAK